MRILGIETSCDDTGVAIFDEKDGLVAHRLASQIDTHQPYGGVVPELAARDHLSKLLHSVDYVLSSAENKSRMVDAIAFTAGPGLAGALLVGASLSKSLAYGWGIPALGIHHLEGHLLAPMLEKDAPKPPFLALLVSGGHTMIVDVEDFGRYRILGNSLDDAVGETFDKTAKMLGLGYPGGPQIEKKAKFGEEAYNFPRPMLHSRDLNMSFSGLKTAVLTVVRKGNQSEQDIANVAHSFQKAVIETLLAKCKKALVETNRSCLVVSGGVGANQELRDHFSNLADECGVSAFYPRHEFCTDNGAMIAYAGFRRFKSGMVCQKKYDFDVFPKWSLEKINS